MRVARHEPGAFTGAVAAPDSAFALADGGTLFLGEVGDLPLRLQPELLRDFQSRHFRVFSKKPFPTDTSVGHKEGCFFFEARKLIIKSNNERFQNSAQDYASYLESPEGRLRIDLAFENLQEFLHQPQANKSLFALDVGAGTGATAVRLARLGFHVTLLDSSQAMLDIARLAAEKTGVTNRVTFVEGDAAQLTSLFSATSFDVVLCHNVLEFVDDPTSVLRDAARLLRDASGILSIVVRNQTGEVFKAAILAGDLAAAETNLTSEWGSESLYGGKVRLFTASGLQAMLDTVSLTLIAERGVRVLADYLPPHISRSDEYTRILDLEKMLGSRPEYAAVARYTHCLVRRTESGV